MIFLFALLLSIIASSTALEYSAYDCKVSSGIVFHAATGLEKSLSCNRVGLVCLESIYNSSLAVRNAAFRAVASKCSPRDIPLGSSITSGQQAATKYFANLEPVWFQSNNGFLCAVFIDLSGLDAGFLNNISSKCYQESSGYQIQAYHPLKNMSIDSILEINEKIFQLELPSHFGNRLDGIRFLDHLKQKYCKKITSFSQVPQSVLNSLTYGNCLQFMKSFSDVFTGVNSDMMEKINNDVWSNIYKHNDMQDSIDENQFFMFAVIKNYGVGETELKSFCENFHMYELKWNIISVLPEKCFKISVLDWSRFTNFDRQMFNSSYSNVCYAFENITDVKKVKDLKGLNYSDFSLSCLKRIRNPLDVDLGVVNEVLTTNEYDQVMLKIELSTTSTSHLDLLSRANASKFCSKLKGFSQVSKNGQFVDALKDPAMGGKQCITSIPDIKSDNHNILAEVFGDTKQGFEDFINGDETKNCKKLPNLLFISVKQAEGLTKNCYDLIINRFEPKTKKEFWDRVTMFPKPILKMIMDELNSSSYEHLLNINHVNNLCNGIDALKDLKDFMLRKVTYDGCIRGKSFAGMSAENIMKLGKKELGQIKLAEFDTIEPKIYTDLMKITHKRNFCTSFRKSSEVMNSTVHTIKTDCSGNFRQSTLDDSSDAFTSSECHLSLGYIFKYDGTLSEPLTGKDCKRVQSNCIKALIDHRTIYTNAAETALKELAVCRKEFEANLFSEFTDLLTLVFGEEPSGLANFIDGEEVTQCKKITLGNLSLKQAEIVSLSCVQAMDCPLVGVKFSNIETLPSKLSQDILAHLETTVTEKIALQFCKSKLKIFLKTIFDHLTFDNCLKDNTDRLSTLDEGEFKLLKTEEVGKFTAKEIQSLKKSTYDAIFKATDKATYCGLFYTDSKLQFENDNIHEIDTDCKDLYKTLKGKTAAEIETILINGNKKITDPSLFDEESLKNLVRSDKECGYFASISIFPESLFDSKLKKDCVLAIDESTRWDGMTEKIFAKLSPDLFKEDDVINLEALNVLDDSVLAGMTLQQFVAITFPDLKGKTQPQITSLFKSHLCFRLSDNSIGFKSDVKAFVADKCDQKKWEASTNNSICLKVTKSFLIMMAALHFI